MRPYVLLPLALILALPVAGSALGAEVYYVKDDGSRWTSSDGTPILGAHKASTYICKQDGGCFGLIYAGRGLGAWRQRGAMWEEVQMAHRRLEEAEEGEQVELDPTLGRALYQSAEQGYMRATSGDK